MLSKGDSAVFTIVCVKNILVAPDISHRSRGALFILETFDVAWTLFSRGLVSSHP